MLQQKRFGSNDEVMATTEAYFGGKGKSFYKGLAMHSCRKKYMSAAKKSWTFLKILYNFFPYARKTTWTYIYTNQKPVFGKKSIDNYIYK